MTRDSSQFDGLREALRVSPDNVPLRKHLAELLLNHGYYEEAEQEFREALRIDSGSTDLKLGLARSFAQQGKNSHALVIVEELVRRQDPSAQACLLHARLSLRSGDVATAVSQYKHAREIDPELDDPELAELLGIDADPQDSEAEVVEGRVRQTRGEESAGPDLSIDRPQVGFQDVGGMEALKEEIRLKIIYPLQHAEMYAAYGKTIGGGILMYGPPGCGKTYLARATAGEISAGFLSVGISDVLDMWIGNSERNLHQLFEQARRNSPSVLFFDEVDALGASRSDMRHSGGRHLINQFLAEMDGVDRSNEGVLILGATNAPWHLDSAFRRPGRFDRILFVPPPDTAAREEILRILCRGKPSHNLDFATVAKKTKDFSGADLRAVVDQAVENKLRQAMKTGKPEPLVTKELLQAAKQVKPSTQQWFATARNHALYANQGGLYDDILDYLGLR